jgi:two-component system sensor histidine kinase BaeS
MRPRLWHRWFALSAGLVVLALAAMLFTQQGAFRSGLLAHARSLEEARLPGLAEALATEFQRDGGWHRLLRDRPRWVELARADRGSDLVDRPLDPPAHPGRRGDRPWPPGAGPRGPGFGRRGPPADRGALDFVHRLSLLAPDGRPLIGPPPAASTALHPIRLQDATVGLLALTPLPQLRDAADIDFARQQARSAAIIAVLVLLAAALASLAMSRWILRRVDALATASRRLAAGDLSQRIGPLGRDELGALASDFDRLTDALQRGREARDRWIADISHELRTPLTILRGELHALQDGIRPLERSAIDSMAAEADRLAQRIDDLYALALSDSGGLRYRFREVDLVQLVSGVCASHAAAMASAELQLDVDLPASAALEHADPDRLEQLLANLLGNCLRYTERGGRVRVALLRSSPSRIELRVEDSAPGVPAAELGGLFERHRRGEIGAQRAPGGAGLGLSICRNIVEAHGGRVAATPSRLGGLCISVELPLRAQDTPP